MFTWIIRNTKNKNIKIKNKRSEKVVATYVKLQPKLAVLND